jgi:hypothetical protein
MKFIGRHLNLIGILMLATLVGAAAGLYWDAPGRIQKAVRAKDINTSAGQYSCPMHPEIVSASPGKCPKCGMALTLASEPQSAHAGCGAAAEQTEPHGCCAKPQSAELNLPPGHPPIPGQNAHAGCAHEPETVPSAEKSSK